MFPVKWHHYNRGTLRSQNLVVLPPGLSLLFYNGIGGGYCIVGGTTPRWNTHPLSKGYPNTARPHLCPQYTKLLLSTFCTCRHRGWVWRFLIYYNWQTAVWFRFTWEHNTISGQDDQCVRYHTLNYYHSERSGVHVSL